MALPIGIETSAATIAGGASLSGEVDLGAKTLVGIAMPAAWDAADLTFQVSVDGTTWLDVQSTSAELDYKAAAGQYISVDPSLWRGANMLKVRSGTKAAAVNQTAQRVITLVIRPVA